MTPDTGSEPRTEAGDWSDFEPQSERDHLAYSLMVAGVCIATETEAVRLDYRLADDVLADLHHRGRVIAEAARAPAARAAVIAEIRAGVEGLPRYAPDFDGHMLDASDGWWLLRRDVLALLPPTEPKT